MPDITLLQAIIGYLLIGLGCALDRLPTSLPTYAADAKAKARAAQWGGFIAGGISYGLLWPIGLILQLWWRRTAMRALAKARES